MRTAPLFFIAIIVGFLSLIEWTTFNSLIPLANYFGLSLFKTIFWFISISIPVLLITCGISLGWRHRTTTRISGIFISVFIAKIVFLAGYLFSKIFELIGYIVFIASSSEVIEKINWPVIQGIFASGLAVFILLAFIYGITKGKHNYTVHRHTLFFKDLPVAFDGFTITQISDIHSGSFHNKDAVARGVQLIKEQNSDLFVFTGDLVNNQATEIEPWIDLFKEIKAPFGKFSILGNHDYGDYISWPSPQAKSENMQLLFKHHKSLGFQLLLDEHIILEKDDHKIALLGVENWGIGFGKRGNLAKALHGLSEDTFKILLSHDPSHWDHEVKNHFNNIHLTFSGHTHGMQLGIELFGWKWSPSKFRYPKWAGLYQENERYLYVNRGFGYLGFSGRVGIWPEITVIELKRKV